MKITEKQLRRIINEMMLDMDHPSEVEPQEDAWSGGDENLVHPIERTKAYKLIESSVRKSLKQIALKRN